MVEFDLWANIACVLERRINNGKPTDGDRRFMVYLVQSELSSPRYDSWLCGGSLISPHQILTAASCLVEMDHIYAIAGYTKYVSSYDLDGDECVRRTKRKVVKTCVPKQYNFSYSDILKWQTLDIGVAIVDKPYDPLDVTFRLYCSYIPSPILVNYNPVFIRIGMSAIAFGWGAIVNLRRPKDIIDRNSEYLREAPITLDECSENTKYFNITGMTDLMYKYLICAWGKGLLDGDGRLREVDRTKVEKIDGCNRRLLDGENQTDCLYDYDYDEYRRDNKNDTLKQAVNENYTKPDYIPTRRQVLCQNDHGGPLVTWVGNKEMLIGVALISRIQVENNMCLWPNLFTSTACASKIVNCLLSDGPNLRNKCADTAREDGFEIHESIHDWDTVTLRRSGPENDEALNITYKPINQLN